jgi:subtilisin family serine protease
VRSIRYLAVVIGLVSAMVNVSAQDALRTSAASAPPKALPINLIVLRNPKIPSSVVPADSAELVNVANSQSPRATEVLSKLQMPSTVRYVIAERPDDTYLASLKPESAEWRLLNYVLLQYPDATAAETAKLVLQHDGLFSSTSTEMLGNFSTTPNDPYFSPAQPSPLNKQWGMSALNLPSAWNTQTGYAYLGVADNGIQRNHSDLAESRTGNVRAHFSGSWTINSPVPSASNFDESFNQYALGHGTHVAGIVAATSNNSTGVSGACWNCSLAIAKTTSATGFSDVTIAMSIYGLIRRGVQAINLSLGFSNKVCVGGVADVLCDAIQLAVDRDTVIVAAAGNHKTNLQFPASDPRAFSIGGYQSNGQTWDQQLALGTDSPARISGSTLEIGTNYGANQLVVAPARDVLSTFYTNQQWDTRCGSVTTFNTSPPYSQFSPTSQVTQSIYAGSSGNQYGICTGTSMAAPHITGAVGLIRSTNPLLTISQVRNNLQQAAGGFFIDNIWGYGLPNINTSVVTALPSQRLTPLFAFYNPSMDDYAYTVFPQMGAALNGGTVPPFVGVASSTGGYYSYSWLGNPVSQFPTTFLGVVVATKPGQVTLDNYRPRARLRVFATQRDDSGNVLWPICRFSYVVGTQVRHLMDTSTSCAQSPMPSLAILDGSEGYVYPPNQSQPSGTVAVIRMEKIPAGGGGTVFILSSQTDQAYYTGIGFSNPVTLGYAYLN